MRSYGIARFYFSLVAFIAWIVIAIGVLIALTAGAAVGQMARFGGAPDLMSAVMASLPGIGIVILGLLVQVGVQTGRASVDSAEYTQQMLKIARDQLEVSRQALRAPGNAPNSFAALNLQNAGSAQTEGASSDGYRQDPSMAKPKQVMLEHPVGSEVTYQGEKLRVVEAGYVYGGMVFPTFDMAKENIDGSVSFAPAPTNRPYEAQLGVNPAASAGTFKPK